MSIQVNEAECIGCGTCVQFCPVEAIELPSNFLARVIPGKCNDCLECIYYCPAEAIEEA